MGFLDAIFGKSTSDRASGLKDEEIVEAGACPGCWGYQQYDDKFVEVVKDRQKDILNADKTAQKAFVAKFVEEHISGIRLKKDGDQMVCPACKTGYKTVSSKIN